MKNLFVVTGASSGIGQSIAWALSESGATVIACGRNPQKLEKTLAKNSRLLPIVGDLRQTSVVQELVDLVQKQPLPLKGLINNAGVFDPGMFIETPDEVWQRQFDTNLMSAVRVTRALYPFLKKAAPTSVLNISSTLGIRSVAGTSAYSAIKAAMISWTETLALEWAPDKIRVNCICPGFVDTPIHAFHNKDDSNPERLRAHGMQPLKRMGKPEEIAWTAEFLLSEKSAWTTGSVLSIDGGIHL